MAKFEVYQDVADQYRWRLRDNNERIIAISAQGYAQQSECEEEVYLVKQSSLDASIVDLTDPNQADAQKTELVRYGDDRIFAEMPSPMSDIQVHLL